LPATCRAPIDLAQKIGHIVGDDIDDVKRERLGGGHACGGTHRVDRPFGVAAIERGKAANVGDSVIERFARLRIRRFT
jgi:hypothetical protein